MRGRALRILGSPVGVTMLVLAAVIFSATTVYMVLEGWSGLTALIFTLETVTTVGYGNVFPATYAGQAFTAGLLIAALGVVAVGLVTIVSTLIRTILMSRGVNPMEQNERAVAALRDHVVVVADEGLASALLPALRARQLAFVAITQDGDQHAAWVAEGYPSVLGNPEEEEVLRKAGVERALGLIAALPSDAENVFVALSAHGLNPRLRIAARAHSPSSIPKLRRSGADEIVLPEQVTAINLVNLFQDRTRIGDMVRQVTQELRQSLTASAASAGERSSAALLGSEQPRPEHILFRAVRLALQELSPDMEQTLFALGAQFGREAVGPNLAGERLCDALEKLGPVWSAAGLGSIEVVACTEDGARLAETHCATCEGMPNVGKPVCHLERGVLNGALEAALGRSVNTRETKCWGMGDRSCEFEITSDMHVH